MRLHSLRYRSDQATVDRALRRLSADLRRLVQAQFVRVGRASRPDVLETVEPFLCLVHLRQAVASLTCTEPSEAVDALNPLCTTLTRRLQALTHPPGAGTSRIALVEALLCLERTVEELLTYSPAPSPVMEVTLPSVLLLQMQQQMLPPERMLLVARTVVGGRRSLCAGFDVTGADKTNACYVKAGPDKLAQALIAMDTSGTSLGAWAHSHPGSGPGATCPSSIDTAQDADWQRDYPGLLAIIMTADRYVRFWGAALTAGHLRVLIDGPGTTRVDDHVYRLV